MTYNIHPIVVHFPIAFLVLYSLIRIVPFEKWLPKVAWRDVGFVLILVGVLGAMGALSTGELAEEMVRADHDLVETHAFFATFTTWIYAILLAGEISRIFNRINFTFESKWLKLRPLTNFIEKVVGNKNLTIVLAIVGVIGITITGMLGGIIVYGTSADPLAPFILSILGL